ncbi:MAG: RidA family protein [Desulfobacteraceae bacterium]|nr:MAG: RidA family protein [Desulfobacteraceae bacterium]
MKSLENRKGNYFFLTGSAPYSSGVAAADGHEILHATLKSPIPYRRGFDLIERHLESIGRPRHALCAVELRCPKPFSFDGFDRFNEGYQKLLADWDLLVDGNNPVARTNIAPEVGPPEETLLYAFSYTVRRENALDFRTFVIAGGGEIREGKRSADAIVRYGETTAEAMGEKAAWVMELMRARLDGLKLTWSDVTAVDIYTVHPIHPFLPEAVLGAIGMAAAYGIRWFYGRPPIAGLEYEMDMRGIRQDMVL